MSIYEIIDNTELEGYIENIVAELHIEDFFLDLLQYMENEGPKFWIIPETLWSNIFEQSLSLFIQYFLVKNTIESL